MGPFGKAIGLGSLQFQFARHPVGWQTPKINPKPEYRTVSRDPMRKTTTSTVTAETSPEHTAAAPENYESALEELEKLVMQLEGGQMPLDQLLMGYQRGAQLLKFCRDKLEAVDNQIKVLEGTELKPWAQE
jgi:exodeoxyribonuclease VII small subunit